MTDMNESKLRALKALDTLETGWHQLLAEANTLAVLERYVDGAEEGSRMMGLIRSLRQEIKPSVYRIPFPTTVSLLQIRQGNDLPLAGGEIAAGTHVHLNVQDNLFYSIEPRYTFDGMSLVSALPGEPVVVVSRRGDRCVGDAELYLWVREVIADGHS